MSIIFVPDTKGRLINMAHVLIIDRDHMAKLVDGTTVALVDSWDREGEHVVLFGNGDVAGPSPLVNQLGNIEGAINQLRLATS